LQSGFPDIINQIRIFMNTRKINHLSLLVVLFLVSCASSNDTKNCIVLLKTTLGDITVRLYDETPVHRDNFITLIKNHVYEGVTFHRVIKDFMIQSGDPETKIDHVKGIADSLASYTIPAEHNPALFHKKGALAAAREGNDINPLMRSSGTQFYIVQGIKYSEEELNQAEQHINNNFKQALFIKLIKEFTDSSKLYGQNFTAAEIKEKASIRMFETLANKAEYRISAEQRRIYKTKGGTPRLDGTYTVFGEVVEGLEIVDKIAYVKTNETDMPITDIRIIKTKLVHR
jgi:peptidylprolyl isomerase